MAQRAPVTRIRNLLLSPVLAVSVLWTLPALFTVTGVSVYSGQALAQNQKNKPPERKTRRTPALRNHVYEMLQEAQLAAEADDFNGALNALRKLEKAYSGKKQLNAYEKANVYNFYAFIYYSKEDYKGAIRSYKSVLAQPDIPEAMEVGTLYSLSQLYFVVEDYRLAAETLRRWFKVAFNPNPDAYMLLAQANYQLKKYDAALKNVEAGFTEARERGMEPKEQWYLLQRVLYYEKNDYVKTAEILEILVQKWPKKDYWIQLSGMYSELKEERKQMLAMEAVYEQGLLTRGREQVNMAYMYLGADMPYKAAKVLDKGLNKDKTIELTSKNLETLGIAWRQAQHVDRAIPEMERAAKLANQGELWARLANIYLDNDQYKDCVTASNKATNKGKLRRRDNVQVVLGMCLYNLNRLSQAKKAFAEASKDKRSRRMGNQWKKYLDSEIKRAKDLAAEV